MHEVSLMEDIISIVEKDLKSRHLDYIESIELLVGDLSSAMPDALQMAFDIMKSDKLNPTSLLPTAKLVIQREEAEAECIVCNKKYIPDMKIALCPDCKGPFGKIIKGESFQIISYEGGRHHEDHA